ncbi:MAG: hypothetical protein HRT35_34420, partial [Algicola sp.]|nr:hypothetical protein [Algicola sp.]
MNSDTEGPSPQNMALFGDFAKGYINTQLLLLSARLQLPEILSHGAKSLHELTLQTQCDGPVLKRFLRGMVSLELVKEIEHDLYDKGPLLCMVNNLLGPGFDETSYQSWSKAMHTLKTGKPGWNEAFGQSFYDYLDQHPQKSQEFDQWNANSLFYLDTILNQYDFGQFKTLVDLGGGSGSFLIKLLEENPHLHGTIFDREEVIKNTNEVIKGAGPVARIQTQPGSFFDKVPNGADAYTICRVLLNWDDNQVIDILKNCKAAMNQT